MTQTVSVPAEAGRPRLAQRAHAYVARLSLPWELAPVALLAGVSVVPYLLTPASIGLPFDDSYISLLFARNLARHGFLTFDGESASAGATSILHVSLLAVPIKLGFAPVGASIGAGIATHLALVASVYWLARVIFADRLAGFAAAVLASVTGYLVLDALNGMETTLFLAVSAATAAAFVGARTDRAYLAAGVLGALAVLTRPEAVLLLGAMVMYEAVKHRRWHRGEARRLSRRIALLVGPALVTLGAMALFFQATTGTFTPGTATAKLYFFREFEASWDERGDATQNGIAGFGAPLIPFLALASLTIRRRESLLFVFFWVAFTFMYYMLLPGGLTHYWYRYQHVFLPPLLAFAGGGLALLIREARWRTADAIVAVIIGTALLAGVGFQYNSFRGHYARDVNFSEQALVPMALYLRDNLPPDATVATHDIGAVGYFSDREVIDLVGLVNPDVVEYHDGRRVREYVDEVQPDYVVLFPSWELNFLHLALDPFTFETVREFRTIGEPYILYRTFYNVDPGTGDSESQ